MFTNALIDEKSPYLKQHAHNPVAWLPWGEAAFAKARQEDKPIFLSIGYSTCHWCHVMAHESFEDESTAEVLNNHFVPVKIDREERPDIDRVYMLFVQASTGSGGWPMSVWLTPDLKPFYGGTYFPPDNRYGRPGFRSILQHLAAAWRDDRARIIESSTSVTEQLQSVSSGSASGSEREAMPDRKLVDSAYWQYRRGFDARYGGFGAAPKFPRPSTLNYLLRYYAADSSEEALDMVTTTLRAMAAGGMHDQLGGGFHRYSVDERWLVPHFEKMLYDQAQLATAYLEAFQATGDGFFATVVEDILAYVGRDMTSPEGAFYSAEDADSQDPENPAHHGEGAFYIWRQNEIGKILGPAAPAFCSYFGVEPEGNVENDPQGEFTGRNILHVSGKSSGQSIELREAKQKLFAHRESRPRPHLDSKILTSWNALMISAFARAAGVLPNETYLQRAVRAADFILANMYDQASGRLLRRYCEGEAAIPAFADDYAFLAQALLDLFEVSGQASYLSAAADLCLRGLKPFEDEQEGGFFSTAADAPDVLFRMKDEYDGAEPSANSIAADVLLRLAHLTGDPVYRQKANRTLGWFSKKLQSQPTASPQALAAAMRSFSEPSQIAVRSQDASPSALAFVRERRQSFLPYTSVVLLPDDSQTAVTGAAPFLGSLRRDGRFTTYKCENFTCQLPETTA